jgi:hypothetical protein
VYHAGGFTNERMELVAEDRSLLLLRNGEEEQGAAWDYAPRHA